MPYAARLAPGRRAADHEGTAPQGGDRSTHPTSRSTDSPAEEICVKYLFILAALIYLAILTIGALSGRLRLRNGCCAPAEPAKDLRMRDREPGDPR
jgi:hypothetical protein